MWAPMWRMPWRSRGSADDLVLVDMDEKKVASECQDLRDAAAYLPHRVRVAVGDFADLGDCDVIVNSTGKIDILRANHNRVDEMDFTIGPSGAMWTRSRPAALTAWC